MSLIVGVVALNVLLLLVGYCLLAGPLGGLGARVWASYSGVALLAGAGSVGFGMFLAAIVGASDFAITFPIVAVVLAAAGIAFRLVSRGRLAVPPAPNPVPASARADLVATAACFGVVAIAGFALVGGFRSSPWLDDVWGIWVAKGRALDTLGLDPRLFAPSDIYESFGVPWYPLWWSVVTALDLRFVGKVDLHAVNAQLTILVLAFFAAAARLLWGRVRPWLVWSALLLLAASPEFFRHAQGGVADLPLAIYLSLAGLCLVGWLADGRGFHLVLAVVFAAVALQIKSEALPQTLIVFGLAAIVVRERRLGTIAGGAVALAAAIPWFVWRKEHGVEDDVLLSQALDPTYLLDRSDRLQESVETVGRHLVTPREWLFIVPLLLVLALVGFARDRRALWLAPVALLGAEFAFWVWSYWAHRDPIDYLLSTSSYRVVDTPVMLAWVFVPLLAEALLARRST